MTLFSFLVLPLLVLARSLSMTFPLAFFFVTFDKVLPQGQEEIVELAALLLTLLEGLGLFLLFSLLVVLLL